MFVGATAVFPVTHTHTHTHTEGVCSDFNSSCQKQRMFEFNDWLNKVLNAGLVLVVKYFHREALMLLLMEKIWNQNLSFLTNIYKEFDSL